MQEEEKVNESVERIVHVETVLFAEHGFHSVTTREIAAAAGLNTATVHYQVGTKEDLYSSPVAPGGELFQRFSERITDEAIHDPTAFRELIDWLVDEQVDLVLRQPQRPHLWMRRWLEKPGQFDKIEAELAFPLMK